MEFVKARSLKSPFQPLLPRITSVIFFRKASVFSTLLAHLFDNDELVRYFRPSTAWTKRGLTFSMRDGNGFVVKLLFHPSPSFSSLWASYGRSALYFAR